MKTKYSVDDDNRLTAANGKETIPVNGTFEIGENNNLIYWLNEPETWRVKHQLPEKLVFTGNWSLDPNNDLQLELSRNDSDSEKSILIFKGEIISCESEKLVFELKTIDKNGLLQVRLLKLSGTWAADELNRIYFSVSKKESPDTLTLQGAWQLNKNQQIIYTCQKTNLKTKDKTFSVLTFSGFWQISSINKLTYMLCAGSNSKFDFKVQIETPNIYPKEGVIKYRLGVGFQGLSPKGTVPKIISLYGTWKINRSAGVSFDMEYAKGQIRSLDFGAEVNFNKDNEAVFSLKNDFGEDLGISVVFKHRF